MYLHITLTSHYSTLLRRSLGCCPSEGELHDLLTEMEEEEPTGTRDSSVESVQSVESVESLDSTSTPTIDYLAPILILRLVQVTSDMRNSCR